MAGLARSSVALAALFAMSGCGSAAGVVAEKAADSMDSAEYEIAFIVHAMNGLTASTMPAEAVNASAAQAADFWTDGCYGFSTELASITYELTECSGPFGIVLLTGSVTITYNNREPGVGFTIEANDLLVGENAVSFMVTAEVSTDGRNVRVMSSGSVLGRRGHMLTRSGEYNLQWNGSAGCAGIDSGSWETVIDGETFTTVISGWRRCGVNCPAAGGSVRFTGPASSITIDYDSSREATWTSGDGEVGTIGLHCGEG